MRLGIIGTGYVGLVSGTCLAEFGHDVVCMDINDDKINALRQGQIPIYEPGLEDLVQKQIKAGRLTFTTDMRAAVADMDAVFIAVPTPPSKGYEQAEDVDLSYVYTAASDIAQHLNRFTVIVDKSTVPVGTARQVAQIIRQTNPRAEFEVASNPEFLREGTAIDDFIYPDRVVFGVDSDRAAEVMRDIYQPLPVHETPIVVTSVETAEIIKYAANAFLATKITFINEIARLCEVTGGDVQDVAKALGLDKRIAPHFLNAGPGIGGSCFPKDTQALVKTGRDMGAPQTVVEAVVNANERTKATLAEQVIAHFGGSLVGRTIGVLGVSFKPQTDDMRAASALVMLPIWQQAGAKIVAYDPAAMAAAAPMLPGVTWADGSYAVADQADAIVVLTEWNEFRGLDLHRLAEAMKTPIMFDYRNLYKLSDIRETPFTYVSLGRPIIKPGPVRLQSAASR